MTMQMPPEAGAQIDRIRKEAQAEMLRKKEQQLEKQGENTILPEGYAEKLHQHEERLKRERQLAKQMLLGPRPPWIGATILLSFADRPDVSPAIVTAIHDGTIDCVEFHNSGTGVRPRWHVPHRFPSAPQRDYATWHWRDDV